MTVDPAVIPGLLLLAAEFAALAAVGYVVVRVALRQTDDRMALAQGLVVGLALWGLITNFVLYAVPGLAGAAVGWGLTLILGTVLAWRAPHSIWPRPRVAAGSRLPSWCSSGWRSPAGSCSRALIRCCTWGWRRGSGQADFRRNCPGIRAWWCAITTRPICWSGC